MAAVRLKVNGESPSEKHIARAVQVLAEGGIIVYPTDTAYGLGCDIYSKRAIERIYMLKRMDRKRPLSFVCYDLSDISRYAGVDNLQYRILRQHLPGPYTFILPATKEVPKILTSRSRTVGIRVPKHPVCMALVKRLDHPIVSTTASLYRGERVTNDEAEREASRRFVTAFDLEQDTRRHADETVLEKDPANEEIFTDPDVIEQRLGHSVDLIIDVGPLPFSLSTVVDMTGAAPKVLRRGIGDVSRLP